MGESIKVEASHLAVQRINTGQQDVSPCTKNGRPALWEQDGAHGEMDFCCDWYYSKNVLFYLTSGPFFFNLNKERNQAF